MEKTGILKSSTNLILSKLTPIILLMIINIIFSNKLSTNDYGNYQIVWSLVNLFVIISTFGIPRYFLSFGGFYDHHKKEVLSSLLIVFLLTLVPISIYLFVSVDNFTNTSKVLFIVLLLSQSIYLIQEASTISYNLNNFLLHVNLVYGCVFFVWHMIVLFTIGYSLEVCLIGILGSSFIRNIHLSVLMARHSTSNSSMQTISKKLIDKMELLWFGMNDSIQIVTKWFDKIVLLFLLTSSDFAIYFNGTYEIPLIGLGLTIFQNIIITKGRQLDDVNQIALFKKSALFMSFFLFPLFVMCFFYASPIIQFLFGEKYEESAILFSITSLLLPFRIANYSILLQLKKQGKHILIGSIIDFVVAIGLFYVLYPIFKLEGLAIAVVIATIIQISYYLVRICKSYHCKITDLFPVKELFVLLLVQVTIVVAIEILLKNDTNHLDLLISSLLLAAIFVFNLKKYSYFSFLKKH